MDMYALLLYVDVCLDSWCVYVCVHVGRCMSMYLYACRGLSTCLYVWAYLLFSVS